jgi:hypothetical protein
MWDFIYACCAVIFMYLSTSVLQSIVKDVNKGLPENQRVQWVWSRMKNTSSVYWIWREHAKLYPKSWKRNSFALFMLSMIASIFAYPISVLLR